MDGHRCAGAQGERATTVVLWKEYQCARDDDEGGGDDDRRPHLFARAFSVFNAAQVDGYEAPKRVELEASDQTKAADAFFEALGITVASGAYDAHYRISEDRIYMPAVGAFRDGASYAGTLLHEAAHATGAKHRLDRNFQERFGAQARALEEAVAELTASYVLADLGIAHHPRPDHAAYIASWLALLKSDPHAIFTAASRAQAAADWMHAHQAAARAAA